MKTFTVILFDTRGAEISRDDGVEGLGNAKRRARYLISDEYARMGETTHERLDTQKSAVFAEGAPTGAEDICQFDFERHQSATSRVVSSCG